VEKDESYSPGKKSRSSSKDRKSRGESSGDASDKE